MQTFFAFVISAICFTTLNAQNNISNSFSSTNKVNRYAYTNGNTSLEKWFGNDKFLDSAKTYHKNGKLNEVFHYKEHRLHGTAYKYNHFGEKLTTWVFNMDTLLSRTDHILIYNEKDKAKKQILYKRLDSVNAILRVNPKNTRSKYLRARYRYFLNNQLLALKDLFWQRYRLIRNAKKRKKAPNKKAFSRIYDRLGSIYSDLEMKNHASQYKHAALRGDSTNNRLRYNLAAYFFKIEDYKLAEHYLNSVLKEKPDHAFAHRLMAAIHTDYEDYEKAKYHIDLAFPKEKNLLKYGFANVTRDIRTQRGFIKHKLGDSKSGIADLQEAIRLNDKNAFAYRNLGIVYADIGENESACFNLKKAKALDYELMNNRDDIQSYINAVCNTDTNTTRSSSTLFTLKNKPFVYPNPTKGSITVKNIAFDTFNYTIHNFSGSLVANGTSNGQSVNLQALASGVYILNVFKDGENQTFRVVRD